MAAHVMSVMELVLYLLHIQLQKDLVMLIYVKTGTELDFQCKLEVEA